MKKPSGRRNHSTRRNIMKWHKRTSTQGVRKRRWTIMGRR